MLEVAVGPGDTKCMSPSHRCKAWSESELREVHRLATGRIANVCKAGNR